MLGSSVVLDSLALVLEVGTNWTRSEVLVLVLVTVANQKHCRGALAATSYLGLSQCQGHRV